MTETTVAGLKPFIGMCHECLTVKEFPTERERDLWEKFHPHQESM
jgi:hypothetical protein